MSNFLNKCAKAKTSPQNTKASPTRGAQKSLNFVSRTTPHKKKIPIVVLVSPASQSAEQLYLVATLEIGLNIKEPTDEETEYSASRTACAPPEDGYRANAHLSQEGIITINTLHA